jgi:hypothetical protein
VECELGAALDGRGVDAQAEAEAERSGRVGPDGCSCIRTWSPAQGPAQDAIAESELDLRTGRIGVSTPAGHL